MKWIAVDYGERRTGLAVCDASELIVTPVTPQIEEKSLNKVAEAAAARLAQGAEGVVCGLPRNMDGTEGSRCVKSRRFAARLATACGVPVVLWDERRTTVTAAGILSANSTFGADRKARLDSVSAAVILESFLAWRKAHPGEEPPPKTFPVRKVARVMSVAITMILALLILTGIIWVLLPQLIDTITMLVNNMPPQGRF